MSANKQVAGLAPSVCGVRQPVLGLLVSLCVVACAQLPADHGGGTAQSEDQRFIAAIEDAAVPEPTEVYDNLVSITPSDPRLTWRDDSKQRVLVVTWKSEDTAKKFFPPAGGSGKTADDPNYVVWVTTAPQVQAFCKSLGLSGDALSLRLKQHLGLNPHRSYDRFVEMWVDPHDLFRPCPDPETNDKQCNTAYQGSPQVPRIADYRSFYRMQYEWAYGSDGAPWTRLGYTYDWGSKASKVGASEFILAPGSAYEVKDTPSTDEYCRS